jgi:4-hydroxy-3-polyprenylbenzoate decarboxylase
MFKDLNDFITTLDKERELAHISEPVSRDLEICAVTDRVSKSPGGGPGLLFERPTGFDIPVALNLFGSMKRICLALGVSKLDDLAGEIEELATPKIACRHGRSAEDVADDRTSSRFDAKDRFRCGVSGSHRA